MKRKNVAEIYGVRREVVEDAIKRHRETGQYKNLVELKFKGQEVVFNIFRCAQSIPHIILPLIGRFLEKNFFRKFFKKERLILEHPVIRQTAIIELVSTLR
jgi:hypothetical protein